MNLILIKGCCDGIVVILTIGGENQTDVATGQANPAIDGQLQGTVESLPGSGATYNQESYQRQVQLLMLL